MVYRSISERQRGFGNRLTDLQTDRWTFAIVELLLLKKVTSTIFKRFFENLKVFSF